MMNDKNENKKNDDKTYRINKQAEKLQDCSYCQGLVEFVWVHGHYQCPKCKNVVVSCCGDR